jgi:hypothetical protein
MHTILASVPMISPEQVSKIDSRARASAQHPSQPTLISTEFGQLNFALQSPLQVAAPGDHTGPHRRLDDQTFAVAPNKRTALHRSLHFRRLARALSHPS